MGHRFEFTLLHTPTCLPSQAKDIPSQALLAAAIFRNNWATLNPYTKVLNAECSDDYVHMLLHLNVLDCTFQRTSVVAASRHVVEEVSKDGERCHMEHLRSMVNFALGPDRPATQTAAGAFFESYVHRLLTRGGCFKV